jgi:hypothetical protein
LKEPPIELNEAAKLEREIGDFTVEGKIEGGGEWHEMVNRWGIEVRNGEKSARWTLQLSWFLSLKAYVFRLRIYMGL